MTSGTSHDWPSDVKRKSLGGPPATLRSQAALSGIALRSAPADEFRSMRSPIRVADLISDYFAEILGQVVGRVILP